MTSISKNRIESIDILRGVVMVIMALDHVRDYFYYGAFFNDPTNLETTTPFLFFTRFISNYCAPIFVLLSGVSAFIYGSKTSKQGLFKFLITRGFWLIFLEIVLNNFTWTFNLNYSLLIFQVIWTIGISMVCLSGLIFLDKKIVLAFGLALIFVHNLLDHITMDGKGFTSILWYMLHQSNLVIFNPDLVIIFHYPVLPWIGLMAFGYCLGEFYSSNIESSFRKNWLFNLGLACVALFFILRGINLYGDLYPWQVQNTFTKTILSFFKVTKYPPSLAYILITIGPGLLFLSWIESIKNKVTDFFLVFGRVPLFYYFLHVIVIHALAIIGMVIMGTPWHEMILSGQSFVNENLKSYGYSLMVTYMVWAGVILLLYPLCKKYMIYKSENKNSWWVSYL